MISQNIPPILEDKENPDFKGKPRESISERRIFGTDITKNIVKTPDVDLEDESDPQRLGYYTKEIYSYLHSIERRYLPQYGYLKTHQDITERMRAILIDWLVGVHQKFNLNSETLFLTVNLIDRYLEREKITRDKLQLVGVGAMLVASKYEDIYAPEVKDFEYITDKAYSKEEILEMERKILRNLEFNITTPSSLRFIERYTRLANFDEKSINMAKYLIELPLVEYKMIRYSPSIIAAASVYLTNKLFNTEPAWPQVLVENSPYKNSDLKPCARDICTLMQAAERSPMQNIRKKYLQTKYCEVAKVQVIVSPPNK